jgi:eukaryotic-like serine/threonine-protein kinase
VQQSQLSAPRKTQLGRYEVIGVLGRGGMATVYLANSGGEAGFSRLVAVKVLHPHLAEQEDFVAMLLDEARLAARIHHPNVVPVVDLQSDGVQHHIVMDYVEGCSFNELLNSRERNIPLRIVVTIVLDALNGLQAAHTLTDAAGTPLKLVHRDVTPQNILVGVDGMARLTDFGVALARSCIHHTHQRQLKGKLAFMAPEQIRCLPIDHRADIFSVGCLLWRALTGQALFLGSTEVETMSNVLSKAIVPPSIVNQGIPDSLDSICLRALEREVDRRWGSAAEMEEALREAALSCDLVASRKEIGDWVKKACRRELDERRLAVRDASMIRSDGAHMTDPPSRSIVQQQATGDRGSVSGNTRGQPVLGAGAIKGRGISRSRSRPLWIGSGIVLVLLGGVIVVWARKGVSEASVSRVASIPAAVAGRQQPEVSPLPVVDSPSRFKASAKPSIVASPSEPIPTSNSTQIASAASAGKHSPPKVPHRRHPRRTASPVVDPIDNRVPLPSLSAPIPTAPAWDRDSPLPPR